jgi:membrane-associated protease RseP (regulator of RpoE activity)
MKTIHSLSAAVLAMAAMALPVSAVEPPVEAQPPAPAAPPEPEQAPHHPRREHPEAADAARLQRLFAQRMRQELRSLEPGEDGGPAEQIAPRWMIGVSVEPIEPFIREHLGLPEDAGTRVSVVADGSPAEKAGIEVNDIIISANQKPVATLEALKAAVEQTGKDGGALALEILHKGDHKTVSLEPMGPKPAQEEEKTAEPRPEDPARERRLVEMNRRLDRQQRQIEDLRKELTKLRKKLKDATDDNE